MLKTKLNDLLAFIVGISLANGSSDLRGLTGSLSPDLASVTDTSSLNKHKLEVWFDSDFINTEATAKVN